MAAMAVAFAACTPKEKTPDVNTITEDGFYVVGEATGLSEVTAALTMANGINEAKSQTVRDGMYEKYIVLQGGKEFSLAYVNGGQQTAYGATLTEFKPDSFDGIYADNPADAVFKGALVVGDSAPKMKVNKTGLYHIVLDLNKAGDLDDAQIVLSPVTMGVRGGMNNWGFTELSADGASNDGITFSVSGQELGNNGEFKFAYNNSWKITLDSKGEVKANTNLGKDCKPGGDNIVVSDGAGKYKITLTYKLAAGDVANSFKYGIEQESKASYPENLYMTGNDFGSWVWGSEGVVKLQHISAGGDAKDGCFVVTRFFKAANGVKFSTINVKDDWSKSFGGMTNNSANASFDADGNLVVPSDGLWTVTIDYTTDNLTLTEGMIYGMGDCFGGDWTAGKNKGAVNADGTANITAQNDGNIRVYAPCAFDWWQHEFRPTADGKIEYREGAELEGGFAVKAGDTVIFDFNAGTATVGGGSTPPAGGSELKTADELLAWLANPTADVTLGADIDLSGAAVAPAAEFTGSLDGNGKTITVKDLATPLIPQTSGAVKNVTFAGSFAAAPTAEKLLLAPIGKSTGDIENVVNKASVTVTGAAGEGGATVAGVVAEAYGAVKGCKNEGNISVDASGKDTWTIAVAGVAGFVGAPIEGCENSGEVSLVAGSPLGRTAGMTDISMKYNPVSSVAGVVTYAVSDPTHEVTVKNCSNSGIISFTYDNLNASSAAVSRSAVCGVVANTGGDVSNCHNTGAIYGTMVAADRSKAYSDVNIILHASGVAGIDYFVKKIKGSADQNETNITDCTNSGPIYVDSDMTKSNNAVGGVSAWPAAESASITVIKNCVNSGHIYVKGLLKIRAGGIAGGTNSIEDCKNTGNIEVENADAASVFGLINGFHSQTHTLKNCEAEGTIKSAVKVGGLGGICGGIGNAENTLCEGCKVNAAIESSATKQCGLIVGVLNGSTKNITIGTADSPVKVAGSVNGVKATAANFMELVQNADNYKEGVHTFNVVFGE